MVYRKLVVISQKINHASRGLVFVFICSTEILHTINNLRVDFVTVRILRLWVKRYLPHKYMFVCLFVFWFVFKVDSQINVLMP